MSAQNYKLKAIIQSNQNNKWKFPLTVCWWSFKPTPKVQKKPNNFFSLPWLKKVWNSQKNIFQQGSLQIDFFTIDLRETRRKVYSKRSISEIALLTDELLAWFRLVLRDSNWQWQLGLWNFWSRLKNPTAHYVLWVAWKSSKSIILQMKLH